MRHAEMVSQFQLVLYCYETVILWIKMKLRVFENKVIRRIFVLLLLDF